MTVSTPSLAASSTVCSNTLWWAFAVAACGCSGLPWQLSALMTSPRRATAERFCVFPLFMIDGVLTLAMDNPLNLDATDQVRQIIKCEVDPVQCERQALRELIVAGRLPEGTPLVQRDLAERLWRYHHVDHEIEKADAILVLCSHDTIVARRGDVHHALQKLAPHHRVQPRCRLIKDQ